MNNMDIAGMLGAGLVFVIGAALIVLLVATILFRAATKWVAQQDVSFGMSIAIVILGTIASVVASIPSGLLFGLVGLPEFAVTIASFVVSFCATSCVYFMMLKISFWRASLIQIVMLLILLVLIFVIVFAPLVISSVF
tara:strand:- start:83 stop:496 length:414 start_codon:yes stop_codon:yes gene_type:complete